MAAKMGTLKQPKRPEVGRSGGMHIVGHGIVLNQEVPTSSAEEDYEKARRILIYRDMIEKAGSIQWKLLAVWPYQPTHGEVVQALAETGKKTPAWESGRVRCDSCSYAWFPRPGDYHSCPRCSRRKVTREGSCFEPLMDEGVLADQGGDD